MPGNDKTKVERIGTVQVPENVQALLSPNQVAAMLDLTPRTIRGMAAAGEYPKAHIVLGNRPRWKVETHNGWVAARCQNH